MFWYKNQSFPSNLSRDLERIKNDLEDIAKQSRILTVLFRNVNKSKIDGCMDVLKDSLVHWQVVIFPFT